MEKREEEAEEEGREGSWRSKALREDCVEEEEEEEVEVVEGEEDLPIKDPVDPPLPPNKFEQSPSPHKQYSPSLFPSPPFPIAPATIPPKRILLGSSRRFVKNSVKSEAMFVIILRLRRGISISPTRGFLVRLVEKREKRVWEGRKGRKGREKEKDRK